MARAVLTQVAAELPAFLGPVFEERCRAWVRAHGPEAPWGFLPTRGGVWWDRTKEIDLMAHELAVNVSDVHQMTTQLRSGIIKKSPL